jgi:hypothetical protein
LGNDGRTSSAVSAPSAQTARDLFVGGEATGLLLREREPAVNLDFEDATNRSTKTYVRRGSQFEDPFSRRTGARFIPSLAAVFDLDFHDMTSRIEPM